MRTHNIPSCLRKSKICPYYASWPGAMLTLISSNYPRLEHNFMAPKAFEPLKFYCISDRKPSKSFDIRCLNIGLNHFYKQLY